MKWHFCKINRQRRFEEGLEGLTLSPTVPVCPNTAQMNMSPLWLCAWKKNLSFTFSHIHAHPHILALECLQGQDLVTQWEMLRGTYSKYWLKNLISTYISSKFMNKRILQKNPINLSPFKACQCQTCLGAHMTFPMFTVTLKFVMCINGYWYRQMCQVYSCLQGHTNVTSVSMFIGLVSVIHDKIRCRN